MAKSKMLKKELKLLDVYTIATGATLSAGFFLLPGIAATEARNAIILSYIIAAIPLIPAMYSIIELATAMPRAGGVYFFLDRTMGPYFGTIGGFGTWLALILKVAFSLIGMGAYIRLFFPELEILPIAIIVALLLGILNYFGASKSGKLQILLVAMLLSILLVFFSGGFINLHPDYFRGIFDVDTSSIISTAGLVYISYVGVTKVASLSEEVVNPEKNLPRGIMLALFSAILIYAIGTIILVGTVPIDQLMGDLTPIASSANNIFGKIGMVLVSIAAIFAFVSVANAGTMSASRYPLAMSRDHLMPTIFRKIGRTGIPTLSLIITTATIIIILVFLDPLKIAKLASAFQLLMFALVCFAVIVMRESKIDSYDPGYHSPLYPWMQIIGIISAFYLIAMMGFLPILFSLLLIVLGSIWYILYAKGKIKRTGAIYHIFERLGRNRYDGLDGELRGILKEKGLRQGDPFQEIVFRSNVMDLEEAINFESALKKVSEPLSSIIALNKEEIVKQFMEGTRIGATPVTHGIALPHFRSNKIDRTELFLLRSLPGIKINLYNPINHEIESEETVNAIFFLMSPENDPAQHLRILAQIASRVDDNSFMKEWLDAKNDNELKESLLHDDQFLSLLISQNTTTKALVDSKVKDLEIPDDCLIAVVQRSGKLLIPKGKTILREGDRISMIGNIEGLRLLKEKYGIE